MNAIIVKLTRKGGSLVRCVSTSRFSILCWGVYVDKSVDFWRIFNVQPDSVELVFDDQKREISALGVWLRKVLSALETAFKVRGERLPSEDRYQQRTVGGDGEPVSSSSDLDRRYQSEGDDFYTNDFQYDGTDDYYQPQDLGATVKKPRNDLRRDNDGSVLRSPKRASKGYRSKKSQAVDTFMESFNDQQRGISTDTAKQARRKAKFPTSLDDFEFVQYYDGQQRDSFFEGEPPLRSSRTAATRDVFQASNVRLPGKKRPMAPSDPRWDWLKQGRAKAQAQARTSSSKTSFSGHAPPSPAFPTYQRSLHKNKNQEKLIGHVQNARLQLREKRYQKMRYPSSSSTSGGGVRGVVPSYVPTYGYDPPPMGVRNESMAFSAQQRQSQPQQPQQLSRFESTAFEYAAGGTPGPAKSTFFKGTSAVAAPNLSANSQIEGPRIKWENVFDVLSGIVDDEELAGLHPERRAFLVTCGLLQCSCGRHQPAACVVDPSNFLLGGEEGMEDLSIEAAIKCQASRLRQELNDLRFQEFEFLSSLSGGVGRSAEASANEETSYPDSLEWCALVDKADRYHASLALLVRHAVRSVQDHLEMATGVSSALAVVTRLVRAIVVEISHIVAQLPDCDSLFRSCPPYVFFFEVADRSAKTTPLVTAITRTYWYSIQALLDLKQAVTGLTGAIEAAIENVLPTNRVILAASLFLVDLYLFLPSSYRLDHESSEQQQADCLSITEAPMPAISLWLLLYDCFVTGRCSFQTGKLSASADGRDFWAFLQTMVPYLLINNQFSQ